MDQLVTLREVLRPNFHLSWNLLLALVPLVLSTLLFEDERTRGWFWWLGVGLFAAFLPNAPYALTDVIHLFERFDAEPDLPVWATVLLVIEFSVYILVCFQAYVLSLMSFVAYLQRHGLRCRSIAVELPVSAFCAVGIYLGRIQRLNSWNVVTAPRRVLHQTVHGLVHSQPAQSIVVAFVVITMLYYILKAINVVIRAKLAERSRLTRP
jgi:uncharacterized membrane protein